MVRDGERPELHREVSEQTAKCSCFLRPLFLWDGPVGMRVRTCVTSEMAAVRGVGADEKGRSSGLERLGHVR